MSRYKKVVSGLDSCIARGLKKLKRVKSMNQLLGSSSGLCMWGVFCVIEMKHVPDLIRDSELLRYIKTHKLII